MESTKSTPKAKTVVYWIATAFVVMSVLPGGILQVSRNPTNVEGFAKLGFPVAFMVLLGVWKILGAVALLAPRIPRAKEWAYAGIFIDFSGAVAIHLVNGSAAFHVASPLVLIGFLIVSWALRPASRVLAGASATGDRGWSPFSASAPSPAGGTMQ
jgi:hypothetical protein